MTRTVADSALMLSVMAGPDDRDRHSLPAADFDWTDVGADLKGCRVAYSADWGYAAVDPEVRRIVGDAARVFESELGCTVEEAESGLGRPLLHLLGPGCGGDRSCRDATAGGGAWPANDPPSGGLHHSGPWTAEDLTNAVIGRKALVNKMWRFMRNYDVLLTPTLACPPFGLYIQGA